MRVAIPALVDHVDLVGSLAALTGQELPRDGAVDSFDMLDPLLGETDKGRTHVVEDTKLMVVSGAMVAGSAGASFTSLTDTVTVAVELALPGPLLVTTTTSE